MICIKMIEPASASIAVYLITKGTTTINRDKRLLDKNPFFVKKKMCKFLLKNREEIVNSVIEETNDLILDSLNLIHINPSIFIMLYILILVITIII
jgi:hypothetical protein